MKTMLIRSLAILALLGLPALCLAETLESHTEQSFPAIPGGKVSVDVSSHDVAVTVTSGDTVSFVVDIQVKASPAKAKKALAELTPTFSEKGDTIIMRSARRSRFGIFGNLRIQGSVEVTMPSGMNLEVDTASGDCKIDGDFGQGEVLVDTASGALVMNGAADAVRADTASGDVDLRLSRPVALVDVNTASGHATVDGPVDDVRIDTASGNATARGLTGAGFFDTASGEVEASWTSIVAGVRIHADTSSGDVRLILPAGTILSGLVDTGSGDIESDFPGDRLDRGHRFRFTGTGGVTIDVDTGSGDASVLDH